MKRLLIAIIAPLLFIGTFAVATPVVYAADAGCSKTVDTSKSGQDATGVPSACDPAYNAKCDKTSCGIIDNYVNPAITLLSYLVGLAVVIGVIMGAIQIITSTGDPQKNANGKQRIQNALIALVAYALLYGFLKFLIPGITQ